jgi:flavin reductase (DIM6/NTAB) family NADH-FMN oxidoreductase RutF
MSQKDIAALFQTLSRGVYVVGVCHGERRNAFTVASIVHASYKPLIMALGINPQNASYDLLHAGKTFAVSVLKQRQDAIARHFGTQSGKDMDKLQGVDWRAGCLGAPILNAALAYFDCELTAAMPAGDHEIVLGRVIDGGIQDGSAAPLLYSDLGNMDGSRALYPSSL